MSAAVERPGSQVVSVTDGATCSTGSVATDGVATDGVATLPTIRFARNQGVSLAYQVWGEGPPVVSVPPLAQNIELAWERPELRRILDRLGSFSRHLHFDKRGTGTSDRAVAVPTIDERVDDLAAVMDDAGLERAILLGVSEGGPVALAFAATYPERVDGIVALCSGARIYPDATPEMVEARELRVARIPEWWGTDETLALDVWAPSLAADPSYRAWEPRYERQSASPAALRDLLAMLADIDVRPLLASVECPTLVIHRRHDPILPLMLPEEVVAGVRDSRLVVVEGHDHWAHAGDADAWLDEVEAFVTGQVAPRPSPRATQRTITLRTMGGFAVEVDATPVPTGAWGSRRARQLCKRLAVAVGEPVPREVLADLLWPDETETARLSARLSVVLSHVRRVLGGGVIADRDAVRLDLAAVDLDLHELFGAARAGDDPATIAAHRGTVLPEDAYDDWAVAARERVVRTVAGARHRMAAHAAAADRHDLVAAQAAAILDLDPFDERAHELLVRALEADGRRAEAVLANERYRARLAELGLRPVDLLGPGA